MRTPIFRPSGHLPAQIFQPDGRKIIEVVNIFDFCSATLRIEIESHVQQDMESISSAELAKLGELVLS